MKWKLVASLSLLGGAMGLGSVLGLRGIPAALAWTALAVFCAGKIGRAVPERAFVPGFLTGFLGIVAATLVQVVLISVYLENQPELAAELSGLPTTLNARTLIAISGPFLGAVGGLVLALLSWIASRIERNETT